MKKHILEPQPVDRVNAQKVALAALLEITERGEPDRWYSDVHIANQTPKYRANDFGRIWSQDVRDLLKPLAKRGGFVRRQEVTASSSQGGYIEVYRINPKRIEQIREFLG